MCRGVLSKAYEVGELTPERVMHLAVGDIAPKEPLQTIDSQPFLNEHPPRMAEQTPTAPLLDYPSAPPREPAPSFRIGR